MSEFHTPVLLKEVIEFLNVQPGKKYIDATVGGGGHAEEIVKHGGVLLGIDVDPEALEVNKSRVVQGNFKNIEKIAKENDFYPVAGILYDLGLSSFQLGHSGKGFSFQKDEPLDMRADPRLQVTAEGLVNGLSEKELTELFEKYGEEKRSRSIAGAIARARWEGPIKTTRELASLIVGMGTGLKRFGRIHPATRVFQALRIAVNDELNNLQSSLPPAFGILEPKGRLVVISFHSLEDRIVKNFFRGLDGAKILTKKPVTPSKEEIKSNPRARSAKLRAVEKK